jgi:hypothetical protein
MDMGFSFDVPESDLMAPIEVILIDNEGSERKATVTLGPILAPPSATGAARSQP